MSAEIFHVGVESSASPVVKLEDMLPHRLMTLAGGVTRALSKALARHDVAASEWQMIAALGSFGTSWERCDRAHRHAQDKCFEGDSEPVAAKLHNATIGPSRYAQGISSTHTKRPRLV